MLLTAHEGHAAIVDAGAGLCKCLDCTAEQWACTFEFVQPHSQQVIGPTPVGDAVVGVVLACSARVV